MEHTSSRYVGNLSLLPRLRHRVELVCTNGQDADELFNSVMMSLSRSCTKPTPTLSIEDMAPKNNAVDALFEVGFETRYVQPRWGAAGAGWSRVLTCAVGGLPLGRMKCVESDAEPEVVQTASQRKLRCNIDGGAGAAHQISHMHQGIMLVRHCCGTDLSYRMVD